MRGIWSTCTSARCCSMQNDFDVMIWTTEHCHLFYQEQQYRNLECCAYAEVLGSQLAAVKFQERDFRHGGRVTATTSPANPSMLVFHSRVECRRGSSRCGRAHKSEFIMASILKGRGDCHATIGAVPALVVTPKRAVTVHA